MKFKKNLAKAFTWLELEKLLNNAKDKQDEKFCVTLMKSEASTLNRPQFLLRIYGRFSKIRAKRERKEIFQGKLPK